MPNFDLTYGHQDRKSFVANFEIDDVFNFLPGNAETPTIVGSGQSLVVEHIGIFVTGLADLIDDPGPSQVEGVIDLNMQDTKPFEMKVHSPVPRKIHLRGILDTASELARSTGVFADFTLSGVQTSVQVKDSEVVFPSPSNSIRIVKDRNDTQFMAFVDYATESTTIKHRGSYCDPCRLKMQVPAASLALLANEIFAYPRKQVRNRGGLVLSDVARRIKS